MNNAFISMKMFKEGHNILPEKSDLKKKNHSEGNYLSMHLNRLNSSLIESNVLV